MHAALRYTDTAVVGRGMATLSADITQAIFVAYEVRTTNGGKRRITWP